MRAARCCWGPRIYDAEGNRTKKTDTSTGETWTYGYDNRDQMIWAEDRATDGGTLISRADYKYDVFGNRIEKQLDTDGNGTIDYTEKYAYDGWQGGMSPVVGQGFADNSNRNIWLDTDGSDTLRERYVRGDAVDQLFARVDSGGVTLWELTDRLGSVRDVIDNTGAVKDAIAYDGWGNIISESGSTYRGRYTWTGREFDAETGLQYNRARYYDPAIGRWTTQDPLGFDAGDSNVYRYARNGPVSYVDPSGLDTNLLRVLPEGVVTFSTRVFERRLLFQYSAGAYSRSREVKSPQLQLDVQKATPLKGGKWKIQFKNYPGLTGVVGFSVGSGVHMKSSFVMSDAKAKAKCKFYWVQYKKEGILVQAKRLVDKWQAPGLDGAVNSDKTMPNRYVDFFENGKEAYILDSPFSGIKVPLLGGKPKVTTVNGKPGGAPKSFLYKADLNGAKNVNDYVSKELAGFQKITKQYKWRFRFQTYLLQVGNAKPLGYIYWGFSVDRRNSLNVTDEILPQWKAGVDPKTWGKK